MSTGPVRSKIFSGGHGMSIFLEYVMVRWKTYDIAETVPSGERF